MLVVGGKTLTQVEKFKYRGVAFTSDGRRHKKIDTQIGKSNGSSKAAVPATLSRGKVGVKINRTKERPGSGSNSCWTCEGLRNNTNAHSCLHSSISYSISALR